MLSRWNGKLMNSNAQSSKNEQNAYIHIRKMPTKIWYWNTQFMRFFLRNIHISHTHTNRNMVTSNYARIYHPRTHTLAQWWYFTCVYVYDSQLIMMAKNSTVLTIAIRNQRSYMTIKISVLVTTKPRGICSLISFSLPIWKIFFYFPSTHIIHVLSLHHNFESIFTVVLLIVVVVVW